MEKRLHVCFIDFRKASNDNLRKEFWEKMRFYRYPEKIIRILENSYKDNFASVKVYGKLSDHFKTIVGVWQG